MNNDDSYIDVRTPESNLEEAHKGNGAPPPPKFTPRKKRNVPVIVLSILLACSVLLNGVMFIGIATVVAFNHGTSSYTYAYDDYEYDEAISEVTELWMDDAILTISEHAATTIGSDSIIGLAPFLKQDTLDILVVELIENGELDIDELTAVAPFMSDSSLGYAVTMLVDAGACTIDDVVAIAPFLGQSQLENVIRKLSR